MDLFAPYKLDDLQVEKLDGYISRNYRLKSKQGTFLLKHHESDERNLIEAENGLMTLLDEALNVEVSKPARTSLVDYPDGSFSRLLTYIEGDFLCNVRLDSSLVEDFGKKAAELDVTLSTYKDVRIQSLHHTWDLQHCLEVWRLADFIVNASEKKYVDYFFDQYQTFAMPRLRTCRKQIIHSDLNDQNVLTRDGQVSGVIDFGDMCYSYLINEVAIACAYLAWGQDDPLELITSFIKGYHAVNRLEQEEVELLYYLIPARLCVSICHAAKRVSDGSATEYVLADQERIRNILKRWVTINPLKFQRVCLPEDYQVKSQRTSEILKLRKANLGGNVSLSYSEPIHMTAAAFQYMYDAQGSTYLDAYNNIPHVGHCHPNITNAISRQSRLLNTNTRYLYDSIAEYSEKLLGYFPKELDKVFFVNSGSAASDLAIRLAQAYTNRKHLLALEHGYHGNTRTGIGISPYKFNGKGGEGEGAHITALPLPKLFQGKYATGEEYADDAIAKINELIAAEKHPASFIAEPISGCGGQVPLAQGYLENLKPYLTKNQILCIIDEVQEGFGRLGEYFWGFEMHNIMPDIVVLGKPMGNGHPIGAVVTTAEIAQAFDNGMEFFSSFGGNPVSMEVANAVLTTIEEEGLQQNAQFVGNYFKKLAHDMAREFPMIGDVRCQGLFLGMEMVNPQNGEPDTQLAGVLKNRMKERFILTSTDGPFDNVIKLKPPLCFTHQNVDQFFNEFDSVLRQGAF
ncbi:MAG: aminotransferase class III-fold pyridoxal phosphate-dependent enzyme [Cyclobacteriaceae bacterium]